MDFDDLLFGSSETRQSLRGMLNEESSEGQMLDASADEYGFEDDLFEIGEECDFFDTDDEFDLFNAGIDCNLRDAPQETADAWRFPLNSTGLLALSDDDIIMQESSSEGAAVQSDERFKQQQHRDRAWIIAQIEAMLEKIVDGLLEGSERLTFTLRSRAGISRRRPIAKHESMTVPTPKLRQISFPGKTAREAWNFTVLLRIIELIHSALSNNTIMTKRDIYYKHPDLFLKQIVVDRYVDDLACTLGVPRSGLNVIAASKGLVAGSFAIQRKDGTLLQGEDQREGMLIPKIEDEDVLDLMSICKILVIEKEATFRALISLPQWIPMRGSVLIVTAKGYPDVATRAFLRRLSTDAPHVPMYTFVDLDPDGIAIMSTYKYGSYRLAHEDLATGHTTGPILPNTHWLGLKSCHIGQDAVQGWSQAAGHMPALQGLMRLTARDRTKAVRMLEWDLCSESGPEQEWRHELQGMLMLNVKAEIQILDQLPGGIMTLISTELGQVQESEVDTMLTMSCTEDSLLF